MVMLKCVLLALCISWCSQSYRSHGYFVSTSHPDQRPLELYNQAVHLQRQGEFLAAIDTYLKALEYFPEFPEAHQNLGHLYETQKNFERTKHHHLMSVRHASSADFNATAMVNLVLLEMRTSVMDLSRLYELSKILMEAEKISPTSTHVLFQQALLYEKMGQFQLCLNKLQRVIALDDRHALAYLNIGNYYFRVSNFEVATKFYKHSVDRLPGWDVYNKVLVLNNLGQCYRERGMLKDAYGAFYDALQSLASTQKDTETLAETTIYNNSLQSTLMARYNGGEYDGRAVHFWCLNNMYTIQGMLCDWHNFEYLEHRVELFLAPPNSTYNGVNGGDSGTTDNTNRKHTGEEYQLSSFKSDGVLLDAYTMSLLRYASRDVDKYVCEQSCPMHPVYEYPNTENNVVDGAQPSIHYATHKSPTADAAPTANSIPDGRLIKVGYLSHDWRDHPMGRLTATLVTNHHQQQHVLSTHSSHYTIARHPESHHMHSHALMDTQWITNSLRRQRINATSLSYGANDRSSIRQYVQSHSAYFIDLLPVKNDLAVAEIVHRESFDIVVDLTAHTYNGRIDIVAAQPAPIIINYLGFPGTTGCASFDYSMVQAQIVPPEYASELFSERMLYLPYTYQSNDMLLRVAPPLCSYYSGSITAASTTRCKRQNELVQMEHTKHASSDLPIVPKDSLLVCSFNANKKMEPNSFRSWMQVLHRVPKAVLVLLSVSADVKRILRNEAAYYGVNPKRLVFIPKRQWKEHLIRSAECDLVLDTFVYGAHTTASDVLWMGVPLLSLRGFGSNRMPSRVAASITSALSLPKIVGTEESPSRSYMTGEVYTTVPADLLVVDSIQQYEDMAVRLLHATQRARTVLSNTILYQAVRGAAFDSELMQFSVEFAYQAVYEARQLLLHTTSTVRSTDTTGTQSYTTHMPHIVLSSSAHTSAYTTKSWARKFARDLQQCCNTDKIDGIFASTDMNAAKVSEIFDTCAQELESYENIAAGGTVDKASTGCSVSDFQALVRRLITAYPALSFLHPDHTILHVDTIEAVTVVEVEQDNANDSPHDTTINSLSITNHVPLSNTMEGDGVVVGPVDPDCAAALNLQCAVHLFSVLDLASGPHDEECSRNNFFEQVRACYSVSAPLVMDFLFAVQASLMQNNQYVGEDALMHFLHKILFLSAEEPTHTNSNDNSGGADYDTTEREEALMLLRRVTSFSTYVSPLWRTLSATQLRAVVVHALLPQCAEVLSRSSTDHVDQSISSREQYSQYLHQYRVRVYAPTRPTDRTNSANYTVCRAFLLAHGVVLFSPEEEFRQCEHVLRMQTARLLTDHSVCLQQLETPTTTTNNNPRGTMANPNHMQRAVLTMAAAFAQDPSDARLLNIGTILMDAKMSEIGFFVSSVAVMRMAKSLSLSLPQQTSVHHPLSNQHNRASTGPSPMPPRSPLPRVVFYCNEYGRDWWPGWGPSSLERADNHTSAKGMGGSEEAVYYTSIELAKKGYEVVVYAGVTEADHGRVFTYSNTDTSPDDTGVASGSVTWLHYDYYNATPTIDSRCEVFVAWRYAISLGLSSHPRGPSYCHRKYLWLHDLIPGSILPPSFFLHFDNILVQSDFHKLFVCDGFVQHARENSLVELSQVAQRISILPNGISNVHSFDGINDKSVFVYGSAPGRGLHLVLSQWQRIRAAIPSATLEIYYGFTESAMKELRATQGNNFDAWFAQMQVYLQQDGVKYFGSVDHETLTAAYARAGFLLYPTTFQETGCITVLRAMACGAIPITSRIYPSVLHTLTAGYDLGPTPLSRETAQDPPQLAKWLTEQWTPAVIAAYQQADKLLEHRRKMKVDIQHRYSWAETANTFISLIGL